MFETNYNNCTVKSSEKIYVAAVEVHTKKERQDETQLTTKIDGFSECHLPLNANVLFLQVFVESHPVYDQTQSSGAVFFFTLLITLLCLPIFAVKNITKISHHVTGSKSKELVKEAVPYLPKFHIYIYIYIFFYIFFCTTVKFLK